MDLCTCELGVVILICRKDAPALLSRSNRRFTLLVFDLDAGAIVDAVTTQCGTATDGIFAASLAVG